MLTIWGRKTSSNVQAVMWTVAELGLDHVRHDIGHKFGGNDTPEYLAMNPNGTVPVLRDGEGEFLWESAAIVRYLANRYGKAPFWPEDLAGRTHIDKWAEWAKINIGVPFIYQVFAPVARARPEDRNMDAISASLRQLAKYLDIAERQLGENAFLAGADLTVADIQLGHVLYRYFTLEIEHGDRPALQAYYDRLTENPLYREHVMVSYDELRAK